MQEYLQKKHYFEERPWGSFEEFTKNEVSTVKIITVKPGQALSLQRHKNRDEFWRVLSGQGFVTVENERFVTKVSAEYFIPKGILHRIEGDKTDGATAPLIILEISTGNFDENDIERIEDQYGRT